MTHTTKAYTFVLVIMCAMVIAIVISDIGRSVTPESTDDEKVTSFDYIEDIEPPEVLDITDSKAKQILMRRHSVSYDADHIEIKPEIGVIRLKGRAWYKNGKEILNGRSDVNSFILLDAETYEVISYEGLFSKGMILGLANKTKSAEQDAAPNR
ncbi:hypothetical protein ACFSW8_03775 [Rubritalea tangerina]|uniref:Uncharacterized protein n=1 Tax=Rubritalea tangerina TaxID=430798 RepID=A0ABW4Z7U2_9BACT